MRRALLPILLLAGCSNGPEADLQYISEARSLGFEWAMVNQLAAQGKLTGAYVRTMRESLKEQLGTTASALTQPQSQYGNEIRALVAEPANASAAELRAHAGKLKQIEDDLESD
jgi:hypothetical protein